MVNHFTLGLTSGTALVIANALQAAGISPGELGLRNKLRYCSIQAHVDNAAVIYVGGSLRTLSSTDYGYRIEIPVTTIPYAPTVIELGPGVVTLGDLQVLGTTGDNIQIMVAF